MRKVLLALSLLMLAGRASAAVIPSVGVSAIAVAGSTVTVTTSVTHNLTANQAACFTLVQNCPTILTVPTGTTFTFAQPSNVTFSACASGCGNVQAAPQVIALETIPLPGTNFQAIHYLCWLAVITPVQTGGGSSWSQKAGSQGPSQAQLNAIAAGNIIETTQTYPFSLTLSLAQIQSAAQTDCSAQQSNRNTQPSTGAYYGGVYNGGWGAQ